MKTEELKNIEKEFLRIKNMGYVKSVNEDYTGIDKTFDDLLGTKEKNLDEPTYEGVEVKIRRNSTSFLNLFEALPDSNSGNELKILKDKYGYPSHERSRYKILNTSVQANCSTLVGERFLFKLKLEREEEKLYLLILNKSYSVIEKKVFWNFSTLENKLKSKLDYLALVKAWDKTINKTYYFKYYDIDFYQLKPFEKFLKLLEDGTVQINIKIGVYTRGVNKGQLANHGVSFQIQEIDLVKLFDKI